MRMTDEITTTDELATADLERIKYAKVRLAKGEQTRYDGGRIIGRYQDDLTLRYRGHEVTVNQITEWELVEFKPVTSDLERRMIESQWSA
jgi:hypothetical protein